VSPTENSYSRPVPATFLVFLTCQLRDEAGTILSRRSPRRKPRGFAAHILIILQGDGSRHEINVADPTSEYSRGTEYARRNRLPEITNVIDCSTHTHTHARAHTCRAHVKEPQRHACTVCTFATPPRSRHRSLNDDTLCQQKRMPDVSRSSFFFSFSHSLAMHACIFHGGVHV